MSEIDRNDLTMRILELYQRIDSDPTDERAIAKLDQIVGSSTDARAIYLQCVELGVHLRTSSTLTQIASAGNFDGRDRVVDQASYPNQQRLTPRPSQRSPRGQRLAEMATGLAVAAALILLVFVLIPAAPTPEAATHANASNTPSSAASGSKPVDSETGNLATRRKTPDNIAPIAFAPNNLSHPGKIGKLAGGITDAEKPLPETISFNEHVRPILSENCNYCHGPDANHREADLRLDTADGSENVIDLADPESSELISRINETDKDLQMPPPNSGRFLGEYEKKVLLRWIQQGAQYQPHWAFIPPTRPELPAVKNEAWVRNEIDRFILAKLESNDIRPSPRAQPHVIARRLHLDLTGLPPTVDEVQQFVSKYQHDADMAISSLVDQLLASSHYGERMALPWLDMARYSDSNGFQEDGDRHQWPWRDWVVTSMNDNKPFDQFSIEQLAGDLLENPTRDQLIATAFNRNHMLNGEGGAIKEEQRTNYVFDRVDTTATTWLGMTMACAQCHDHKYDPITQVDYYSFFAYFNNIDETGKVDRRIGRIQYSKPTLDLSTPEQRAQIKQLNGQIKPLEKEFKKNEKEIAADMAAWESTAIKNPPKDMTPRLIRFLKIPAAERRRSDAQPLREYYLRTASKEPWRQKHKKLRKLRSQRGKIQSQMIAVMIMKELNQPRETHLFDRGQYTAKRQKVTAAVPEFLRKIGNDQHKDRLALANWLFDANNPLTSRVTVNRYWQTFFSTGLVKTSEDFGVQGELPSHPELLDWLAVDFRENGWNVKRIHRMIVTSETYLQSSKFRKDLVEIDPENRLLARSTRFRMPSALIRDAALKVSGLLNDSIGGRPVYPYQPDGLWKEFSLERFRYKPSQGNDLHRRSLYTFWRRTVAPPNLFDAANRQTCTVKQSRTNTPLHALVLLNDPTFVETACYLAKRIDAEMPNREDPEKLSAAFAQTVGRSPNQKESAALSFALKDSRQFFQDNPEEATEFISGFESIQVPAKVDDRVELAALASVMQVILNTDEFMTRE